MKLNPLSIPLLIPIEIPAGFGPNFPVSTRTGFLGYIGLKICQHVFRNQKSHVLQIYIVQLHSCLHSFVSLEMTRHITTT